MSEFTLSGTLVEPTPGANRAFGTALAFDSAGVALIASALAGSVGRIHTFDYTSAWAVRGSYIQWAGSGQNLGFSLSMRPDAQAFVSGNNADSVQGTYAVHSLSGASWTQTILFEPSQTVSGWGNAGHLSASNILYYSNPYTDTNATNSGELDAAIIGADWAIAGYTGTVYNLSPVAEAQLGEAIDLSADERLMVVGESNYNSAAGRVQVLERHLETRNALLQLHLESNATDSSSYARSVTVSGSISYVSSPSKFGNVAQFNGSSYLSISNAAFELSARDQQTISFWVYPTVFNAITPLFYNGSLASNNDCFLVYINASGVLNVYSRYNSGAAITTFTAGTLTLNAWSHIKLRFVKNGGIDVYLNGTKTATRGGYRDRPYGSTIYIGHGRYPSAVYYFTGYMRDFVIQDGADDYLSLTGAPTATFSDYMPSQYLWWTQKQVLSASDGVAGDEFGRALALRPDKSMLLVGCPGYNGARGRVVIFDLNVSTGLYVERAERLQSPSPVAGERYGHALDLDDTDHLVVGAPGYTGAYAAQGGLFFYNYGSLAATSGLSFCFFNLV